jgi:hypothetical protein
MCFRYVLTDISVATLEALEHTGSFAEFLAAETADFAAYHMDGDGTELPTRTGQPRTVEAFRAVMDHTGPRDIRRMLVGMIEAGAAAITTLRYSQTGSRCSASCNPISFQRCVEPATRQLRVSARISFRSEPRAMNRIPSRPFWADWGGSRKRLGCSSSPIASEEKTLAACSAGRCVNRTRGNSNKRRSSPSRLLN